jgi:uncharacterized protein YggE
VGALAVVLLGAPALAGVARAGGGDVPFFSASVTQPVSPPAAGLTVVGTGRVAVQPDRAYLTVGVQSTAPTAQAAQAATSRTTSTVLAALKALPMVKNVHTLHVALHPQTPPPDGGAGPSRPSGFQSDQTLGLTVTDVGAVGRVLDVAVKAGANTQLGVSFGVSDAGKARAQALREAVADGRAQAQQTAQAAGLTLKGMTALVVLPSSGGAVGLGGGSSAAPPVIVPGAVQVEVAVQMTFAY